MQFEWVGSVLSLIKPPQSAFVCTANLNRADVRVAPVVTGSSNSQRSQKLREGTSSLMSAKPHTLLHVIVHLPVEFCCFFGATLNVTEGTVNWK